MAGLDGWRSNSTPTERSGIPNESKGVWDPSTVIGLKATDSVLVIGNPAFMPWLSEVARDITSVRKPGELAAFIKEGERFDKIILPRESNFSADLIPLIGALLENNELHRGVFVTFPSDDGWTTEQAIEFYYPDARTWRHSTQFGDVIVSEFNNSSWRYIYV